jgi:hypothetical protein
MTSIIKNRTVTKDINGDQLTAGSNVVCVDDAIGGDNDVDSEWDIVSDKHYVVSHLHDDDNLIEPMVLIIGSKNGPFMANRFIVSGVNIDLNTQNYTELCSQLEQFQHTLHGEKNQERRSGIEVQISEAKRLIENYDLSDDDLFQCQGCDVLLDIEESIQPHGDELYCSGCAELHRVKAGVFTSEAPSLKPFHVSIYEDDGDTKTLDFYCQAECEDGADEKALEAHPNGVIRHITEILPDAYPNDTNKSISKHNIIPGAKHAIINVKLAISAPVSSDPSGGVSGLDEMLKASVSSGFLADYELAHSDNPAMVFSDPNQVEGDLLRRLQSYMICVQDSDYNEEWIHVETTKPLADLDEDALIDALKDVIVIEERDRVLVGCISASQRVLI